MIASKSSRTLLLMVGAISLLVPLNSLQSASHKGTIRAVESRVVGHWTAVASDKQWRLIYQSRSDRIEPVSLLIGNDGDLPVTLRLRLAPAINGAFEDMVPALQPHTSIVVNGVYAISVAVDAGKSQSQGTITPIGYCVEGLPSQVSCYPCGQPSLQERLADTYDAGGSRFLAAHLRPIGDNVAVTGTVSEVASPLLRLTSYSEFLADQSGSNDKDMTFTIVLNAESRSRLAQLLGQDNSTIYCEAIPYGRASKADGAIKPVFPGWREVGPWSLQFNRRSLWTDRTEADKRWAQLKVGTKVLVRGALVSMLAANSTLRFIPCTLSTFSN